MLHVDTGTSEHSDDETSTFFYLHNVISRQIWRMEISETGPNSLQHSHCCSSIMWLHGDVLRCVGWGWGWRVKRGVFSFYPLLSWPPPATTSHQLQEDVNIQDRQLDGSAWTGAWQDHTCVKMSALETGDCSLATNTGRKWPGAAAPWSHGDHLFALGVNRINNISVR